MNVRRTILLSIVVAVGAAVVAGTFLLAPRKHDRPPLSGNLIEDAARQKKDIETLLDTKTPAEAYDIFKQEYADADNTVAHPAAHLFGEALYNRLGADGFAICDSAFGFGCHHSLIGRAIDENGVQIVKQLEEKCIRQYGSGGLGCAHGIGHGVLAYFGYTIAALDRALDVCSDLSWKGRYLGCQQGVFMEYISRTLAPDSKQSQYRPSKENRYEPCAHVPVRFRNACYFEQPSWWMTYTKTIGANEAASWCAQIPDAMYHRSCFLGIGYALAPANHFDVQAAALQCDALDASLEERVWCRQGYAWTIYADPATRSSVDAVCTMNTTKALADKCLSGYLLYEQ